jgi:hypothetical protein
MGIFKPHLIAFKTFFYGVLERCVGHLNCLLAGLRLPPRRRQPLKQINHPFATLIEVTLWQ